MHIRQPRTVLVGPARCHLLFTLVDSTARGATQCRLRQLTQARQVHHEGVFEPAAHRLRMFSKFWSLAQFFELAACNLFPVWPAGNFVHPLAGIPASAHARSADVCFPARYGVLVNVIKRVVVVADARQMRVSEYLPSTQRPVAHARL